MKKRGRGEETDERGKKSTGFLSDEEAEHNQPSDIGEDRNETVNNTKVEENLRKKRTTRRKRTPKKRGRGEETNEKGMKLIF